MSFNNMTVRAMLLDYLWMPAYHEYYGKEAPMRLSDLFTKVNN